MTVKLPMSAEDALQFAFDWSPVPFVNPRCCTCGAGVRRAQLVDHMNTRHPGWLAEWNAALKAAGL
jgi:hypothetical protein